VLYQGIQARANVQVDVFWTDDRSVNPPLPLYDSPDWADGYDVVIHDECAAGNRDLEVLQRILEVHQNIPAVHLHCAMHSFRTGTDDWFQHLGIKSTGHGPQVPIEIQFTDRAHPVITPLKNWTTLREELYNNAKRFGAHPLATGKQIIQRDGKERIVEHVVVWTNENHGVRSFSTTLGHNTATVADPRYLDLVTRGLLWSCGKLDAAHLTPYTGKNKITFVKAKPKPAQQAKPAAPSAGAAPQDATLVKVTASSVQDGRHPWMAIDSVKQTRWCAEDGDKPQWLLLEFETAQTLTGISINWEINSSAYGYKLEASLNGQSWTLLHDATDNQKPGDTEVSFAPTPLRFLRLTGTRTHPGGWISLWELQVKGKGKAIQSIFPKLNGADLKAASAARKATSDPYAKSGNIPPKIVTLTAAEEAAILQDVTVPAGFDVTLFAPAATANYPVYVAAAPNGDLYVSSDGNGSLGRRPGRGRVLRLRDTDTDGRADQVTEFIKDIDSPRGLIWDHDRL
jgi:type 1 glutamine amidotransferase